MSEAVVVALIAAAASIAGAIATVLAALLPHRIQNRKTKPEGRGRRGKRQ